MPLWTPYVDDSAIDLSKSDIKEEPKSPEPEESPKSEESPIPEETPKPEESPKPVVSPIFEQPVAYGYGYHSYPVPIAHPVYYSGYSYTYDYAMPPTQMSPISGTSSCSGYEVPAPPVPVSPQYPARPPSPPVSPVSDSKRLCLDVDELSDDPDFQEYERESLKTMAEKNGGTLLGNNPRMRRAVRSTNQNSENDSYRKQRERNNFAAKQSRDRRKLREIHLTLKVSYLKKEIGKMNAKLASRRCGNCK